MADAVEAWLDRAEATPLPFDAPAAALADLPLAGTEAVFVGELNHFIHEKSDFRALFARGLIARGYDVFAEELGWSDGRRLARYFATRDEAIFDQIGLFGWKGDARADRDDGPPPVFSAALYPHALMRAEALRFYRALAPRAFFGLDIAADSGGGAVDLATMDARSARIAGETIADEIARLEALDLPDAEARAARAAHADHLRYAALLAPAKSYEDTRPAMAFREDAMKRCYAAADALAGGRKVLMAHALHLAKNDGLLEDFTGVGPGGGTTSSLGHHLVQERGLKAFSIWMLYGGGEDSQPLPDLPRTARYGADTLNARLAQRYATPTLVFTDGAPDAPVAIGHLYNATFVTRLNGQVDALYFIPRATPMRLR